MKNFKFPFYNKALKRDGTEEDRDAGFYFGIVTATRRRLKIQYDGDIEIGAVFRIYLYSDYPADKYITIYNTDYEETMTIDPIGVATESGHELVAGDIIEVSTVKGKKHCRLYFTDENGDYKSVDLGFKSFPKSNDWLVIVGGNNTFAYRYEDGEENLYQDDIRIEVDAKIKYEGL